MKNSSGPQKKNTRVREFIANPRKGLFRLALPALIGMLVQTTYSLVDTAFIGRLGADSVAALTFAFPVFFILLSLNSGVAVGMSSLISRYLGADEQEKAENTAIHGILLSVGLAVILFILGMLFIPQFLALMGAEGRALSLGIAYMRIIFFGIFFLFTDLIFHYIFSSQGDTKTPMIVQVISLMINIILDPILIFVLDMGVQGAALATAIAYTCGFFISLYMLRTRSSLHIHRSSFSPALSIFKEIASVGAPATLMMILISVSQMVINRFMSFFG
ncbi:MAG: MATE family efflux transporter, partial [Nanoarchaeota archaeon]